MEIKILSWNVWYKEKAENIVRVLKEVDADIFCLQELAEVSEANPGVNVVEYIANNIGLDCKFFLAQRWEKDGKILYNIGNGIYSRFGFAGERAHYVQDSGGLDPGYDDEGRVYGEADILLNETSKITVATTHLSYTHAFEGSPQRENEDVQLLKAIGKDRKNYFFCGDLNATPDSPLIQTFAEKTKLIPALFYAENTWTTKPFLYQGFEAEGLNWRLDYAFHSLDINVVSSEIVQTDISDHLPILTTIKI